MCDSIIFKNGNDIGSVRQFQEKFKAARIIQNYLIAEARQYSITILENNSDIKKLLSMSGY